MWESSHELIYKLERLDLEIKEYKKFWVKTIFNDKTKFPKTNPKMLIEQAIPKTLKDLEKKVSNKTYYVANVLIIEWLIKTLFDKDNIENIKKYIGENENNKSLVSNYHEFFTNLSHDMILLEQNYHTNINGHKIEGISSDERRPVTIHKNPWMSDETIYHSSMQNIFGQSTFHAYRIPEPMNSIANLRVGIELKLRKLFGASAICKKSDGSLYPIKVTTILDFLKKHEKNIDFPIPISNLIRINNWSNIFIHSGKKDFVWIPVFVHHYLNPMFCRRCVKIKHSTLTELHEELLRGKDKDKYQLYGFEPEALKK